MPLAPTSDTCLACHKPFRENRELASAPRGRRFAFESASDRVWRICSHCGHWNLMGPEAAGTVLPELETRFRAAATGATPGIALTRHGDHLEILRLDDRVDHTAEALTLTNRQRKLQTAGVPLAIMMLVMLGLLAAIFATGWRPESSWWGQIAVLTGALVASNSWRRWRLGLRTKPGLTWFAATLIGAGTILAALGDAHGVVQGAAVALGSGLVLGTFNAWAIGLIRYRLPSGRRLTVITPDLLALRVRWSSDPTSISVVLPNGDMLDAADSRYVLTHLIEWVAGLPDPVLEQARTLAASTSHLGDLLRLLPTNADDTGGETRLDDLPPVYWAALDMALSRETDTPDQVETVKEARRIAEIAEGLDREK